MDQPVTVDPQIRELVEWFLRAVATTGNGDIWIGVYKRRGEVSGIRHELNESLRPDGQVEGRHRSAGSQR